MATKAKKAYSFATAFAEASSYAKATADKTTDRFHGWTRIFKE